MSVDVEEAEVLDCDTFTEESGEVSCNLDNVYHSLKVGLVGDDDVDLGCYLSAYRELYNFFILLGKAFQFVASDVKSKIKILDDFRNEEKSKKNVIENFSTVKKMITYERDNKLFQNKKYVSGSRTLLRLHRGLDFIRKFLAEVDKLDDNKKLNGVCKKTYDQTLAAFHSWVIRNGASLAMHLLPTKIELMKKIAKNDAELIKRAKELLPEMLEYMKVAYERVDVLYAINDLHNLP